MKLKTKILTTVTALILGAAFTFNAGAISTDLHKAVKDGNIEKVKELCEKHPEWINEYDENYFDPIFYAVHMNYLDLVEYLIERGANPNDGLTTAFNENKLDLFKYFVEHGADKELSLKCAISRNDINLVNYLVEEQGANATDGLLHAVWENYEGVDNMDMLEYLVQHGADVNDGFNYCLGGNNFKLAKWFIDHGADVNMKNRNGDTILHELVSKLNNLEHSTEEYPDISRYYYDNKCEKLRAIIEFLRANGAHE